MSDPTISAESAANAWLATFADAMKSGSAGGVADLFLDECYWRDLVAFSWTIITLEGKDAVRRFAMAAIRQGPEMKWRLDGAEETDGVVSAWFDFETAEISGRGNVRLRGGRCWTFFTSLSELKGHEERTGRRRAMGTDHRPVRGNKHWPDIREEEAAFGAGKEPFCVVIGGGQAGIMLAARLRRLNVPTLVIDRNKGPGDVWRGRYKSLYLHDPVWLNHMPHLPFPDDWPVFTPAWKMGDWLEAYTRVMDVDYWPLTECVSAKFDRGADGWTVEIVRDGVTTTLRPRHVVMATGMHGTPKMPALPGADMFEGQLYHASQPFDMSEVADKSCVVVGANSSGHDLAVALWEGGADVTMLQRSSTIVVRSETLVKLAIAPLYSEEAVENGLTTEKADEIAASLPFRLLTEFQKPLYQHIQQVDAEFYESLRRVGFQFDFGEDEAGLTMAALRGRGFYIDVGGSGLIARGEIKLEHRNIQRFGKRSLVLADGAELPADIVVFATGYHPISEAMTSIFGADVVEKIGRCWGLGSDTAGDPGPWEGEIRNMWKPLPQPNLWIMAGNFALGRSYSRLLALQIKARMEGVAGPVYRDSTA